MLFSDRAVHLRINVIMVNASQNHGYATQIMIAVMAAMKRAVSSLHLVQSGLPPFVNYQVSNGTINLIQRQLVKNSGLRVSIF